MSNKLFFSGLTILIMLLCFTRSCKAQNNSICIPSSCGNININYPFRLRSDPANCGQSDPVFVLECKNNKTILHSKSRRYHVQEINYSNFSMRLSDPGLDSQNHSSCPVYSSTDNDLYYYPTYIENDYKNNIVIRFLNCLSPVTNPLYIPNPVCGNTSAFSNMSRIYSYVTVGSILISDLEESCAYDTMVEASSPWPLRDYHNYSYAQIHDMLAYGFQLSWFKAMCTKCDESKSSCILENNKIRCRHQCYEDTPLSDRTFGCKLVYYAAYLMISAMAIGGFIGLRLIFGVLTIGLLVYIRKRGSSSLNDDEAIEELLSNQVNFMPINYSYGEIKKMTSNFKAKLGEGPHGTVYKGTLRSGPSSAVKMVMNSSASDKEFISYVSTVSKANNPNIVKLIGFCIEGTKRVLVNEFVPHGSLENHILLQEKMNSKPSLSYGEMFKISVGIARGIECLHGNQITHLGINLQNILLDQDFNPKIKDSGLAKLYSSHDCDHKGKMGFIPPEMFYKIIGDQISCKADVYSFGMLVLEMVRSMNPSADKRGDTYFPCWIYKHLSDGKELEMRDGEVEEEEKEMVKKMIIVGLWCIQIRPGDRPLMNEVVSMLEGDVELLHMPPMPFHGAMDDDQEFMEKSS